jgi:hypothetical protein
MELGVKCSRGYILHKDCRECALNPTHPCGLTPDLLELMRNENSDEPSSNAYTPSRLLTLCDRKRVLENGSDYYMDIEYAWATIRGHAIHALLEKSGRYPGLLDCIREVRLETSIPLATTPSTGVDRPGASDSALLAATMGSDTNTAIFKGKSDFIGLLRQEGTTVFAKLVDYKTTKYLSAKFLDPWEDPYTRKHVYQLHMYKYLVEKALPRALGRAVEVVVEEMELLYLDMEKTARFTTAGDISYGRKTYKALPTLDMGDIEKRIIRAIKRKQRADITLPPVLPEYPNYWACKRCAVRAVCDEIEKGTAEQ